MPCPAAVRGLGVAIQASRTDGWLRLAAKRPPEARLSMVCAVVYRCAPTDIAKRSVEHFVL